MEHDPNPPTALKDLLPSRLSKLSFAEPESSERCACGEWYPEHQCWSCHDGGRVRVTTNRNDPRIGKTIPCPDCTPSESAAEQVDRLRIPALFEACTLESWLPIEGSPRQKSETFAGTLNGSFLLYGPKGSGKSHLACGVLRRAAERGIGGAFWPVIDLMDRYRSASNPDSAQERVEDIDAELRRARVLVLDDYGVGRSTTFAEERVFKIVDERYRERRALVVTTNADLGAIEERVRSRLLSGVVAQTSGDDRRIA